MLKKANTNSVDGQQAPIRFEKGFAPERDFSLRIAHRNGKLLILASSERPLGAWPSDAVVARSLATKQSDPKGHSERSEESPLFALRAWDCRGTKCLAMTRYLDRHVAWFLEMTG